MSHESSGHASERPVRVLALDPGGTTGLAYGRIEGKALTLNYDQKVLTEFDLLDEIDAFQPNYLICEDFEYRNRARTGLDLTPVKLIGIVRYYGQSPTNKCKVTIQKASKGKSFWSNDKLKAAGLYIRGLPHGRDAARHLLHWMMFEEGYKFGVEEFILDNQSVSGVMGTSENLSIKPGGFFSKRLPGAAESKEREE